MQKINVLTNVLKSFEKFKNSEVETCPIGRFNSQLLVELSAEKIVVS